MRRKANEAQLSEALIAVRERLAANPFDFIESNFYVVNKDARTVQYRLNHSQRRIREFVEEADRERVPFRGIILKSRQVGSTTLGSAIATAKTVTIDNYRTVVLAHLERRAKDILQKCRFFYNHLPSVLQLPLRKNNTSGLAVDHFNSELVIATAQNAYQVRGDTIHMLLGTEAAHWDNYAAVMQEMGPIIPFRFGTYIFQETTGRFRGEPFHDAYLEAKENTLRGGKFSQYTYKSIFLPWHEDPEAALKFETDEDAYEFLKMLQYQQPELFEKAKYFNLTAGQAHYAYRELKVSCHGDYSYFCREYPFDDSEAFQAQGACYFGQDALQKLKPDPEYQSLIWDGIPFRQVLSSLDLLSRIENPTSDYYHIPILKVWRRPNSQARYLVTGDVSEGEAYSDYTSIRVIDMITRETMATFHGKVRPDESAFIMASLGVIYNGALVAPEANSIGHYTLAVLRGIYHYIYTWKKWDKQNFSAGSGTNQSLGWYTTPSSRPLMLSELYKIVKDISQCAMHDHGLFKDKADIEEMRSFTAMDGASPRASHGCHDDRVMSLAMAHIISHQETSGTTYDIYSKYKDVEQVATLLTEVYDDRGTDPSNVLDILNTGRLFINPRNQELVEKYESEQYQQTFRQ